MGSFLERALRGGLPAGALLLASCSGGGAASSAAGAHDASSGGSLDGADDRASAPGSVSVSYSLFGGEVLDVIAYAVESGSHTVSGTATLPDASADGSFVIPAVAAGAGYSLVLIATTVDGLASCSGSVGVTLDGGAPGGETFSVSGGATTPVSVQMTCYMTQASGCLSAAPGACPPSCYLNHVVQPGGSVSSTCDVLPAECDPAGGSWSVSARSCGVGVVADYFDGGPAPDGAFCCTYQLATGGADGGPDGDGGGG